MKNIVILALVVLVVWLSATVVRLENYRYASIVGICEEIDGEVMKPRSAHHECLNNISTRTHFIWHIFYALEDSWHLYASQSSNFLFGEGEWEGFVYPDRDDLTIHRNIGIFASLKSCRVAARDILSIISSSELGDYECGLNCEYRNGLEGIKVCEKTER